MSAPSATDFQKSAVRLVATGIGAIAAGPLGAALGAFLGGLFSDQATTLIKPYLHSGADKLSEFGVHYCFDKFREMQLHPRLEEVASEALRLALEQVHAGLEPSVLKSYDEWFKNWAWILKKGPPDFECVPELVRRAGISQQQEALDQLFRLTMERLDGTARAWRRQDTGKIPTITASGSFRDMPRELLHLLFQRLPQPLQASFNTLIALPEHCSAWIAVEQHFQSDVDTWFARIEFKLNRILEIQERELSRAVQAKEIAEKQARLLRTRIESPEEYKEDYEKLQAGVLAGSEDAGDQEFVSLLAAGDLEGAAALKTGQIESRRPEVSRLAQDLSELGRVHELRFAWLKASECYKEAWRLVPGTLAYGFRYALFVQKQNRFLDAIDAYRQVLPLCTDPGQAASTLNNLAILYRATQRMNDAEQSYHEALTICRRLAEVNPEAYLPDVAMTLNNLAILHSDTQRVKEAEQSYQEALTIYRRLAKAKPAAYLSRFAIALNNLAILYGTSERMKDAEKSYREPLIIYSGLAGADTETHLPNPAMTLNNLAILYSSTQRMEHAEQSYQEALTLRRRLAEAKSEDYLPNVATTLNNLGCLYRAAQRMEDAEKSYLKALSMRQSLAKANPDHHLRDVATTLNNLAIVYSATQRMKHAESSYRKALTIYRRLAEADPETYLPDVATTLNNLANLYSATQRMKDFTPNDEARAILEPLWRRDPEVHGNQWARINLVAANIAVRRDVNGACQFARQALAAAYDPALKQSAQDFIKQFSPGPPQ